MVIRSFGLLRKSLKIFLAVFFTLLIIGCNPNAKEKKMLTQEMEELQVEISNTINQRDEIGSQLNDCKNKISDLEKEKATKGSLKSEYQNDLGEYVLDHKMITLSLIATGGGIAATLEENLDEDVKGILQGLAVVGALYCILNPDECTEVTAQIAYYSDKISTLDDDLSSIDNRIYELRKKVNSFEEEYNGYEGRIYTLKTTLTEKQERYNSL